MPWPSLPTSSDTNSDRALRFQEKISTIADHLRAILKKLEVDVENPSLKETPERVARMYVEELFAGLDPEAEPEMKLFPLPEGGGRSLIQLRQIPVHSMCAHHLLPITGEAEVTYRPNGAILGLSKVHRLVDYFARRPQLQEKLTQEIAERLKHILQTDAVHVLIRADHGCLCGRGVRSGRAEVITHSGPPLL